MATTSKLLKDGMLSEVIAERVPMRSQRKGWKVQHLMSQHGHIKMISSRSCQHSRTVAQELIKRDAVSLTMTLTKMTKLGLMMPNFRADGR